MKIFCKYKARDKMMKIKFRIPKLTFYCTISSKQLTEPKLTIEERKFHDFVACQDQNCFIIYHNFRINPNQVLTTF